MTRLLVLSALAGAAGAVLLPRPGAPPVAALASCLANTCNSPDVHVASAQGRFVDADTWESSHIEGEWSEFFGGETLYLDPDFGGRIPYKIDVFVGVSPQPQVDGTAFAQAAGNIALQSQYSPNHVAVKNGTCSKYYARVIVYAEPVPPPAPPADVSDAGDPDAEAAAGE